MNPHFIRCISTGDESWVF